MKVDGYQVKSSLINLYIFCLERKSIENKLISIEILASPLDLKGKSIECKWISIEILASPLDL